MTLLTSKARGTPREPLSYLARFASSKASPSRRPVPFAPSLSFIEDNLCLAKQTDGRGYFDIDQRRRLRCCVGIMSRAFVAKGRGALKEDH